MPIIRRTYCIYATLVFFTRMGGCLVCGPDSHPAGIVDEMELPFHLIHDTGLQQCSLTEHEAEGTVMCS